MIRTFPPAPYKCQWSDLRHLTTLAVLLLRLKAELRCGVSCGCGVSTELHSRAVECFHTRVMRIERVGPEDQIITVYKQCTQGSQRPNPCINSCFWNKWPLQGMMLWRRDMKCAGSGLAGTWACNKDAFATLIYACFLASFAECQNLALNV